MTLWHTKKDINQEGELGKVEKSERNKKRPSYFEYIFITGAKRFMFMKKGMLKKKKQRCKCC